VRKESDHLLLKGKSLTNSQVKDKSNQFYDETWPAIVTFVGQIYTYATTTAGGSSSASYYAGIMESITSYNDAKKKSPPDTAIMKQTKEDNADLTVSLLDSIKKLKEGSAAF
jgi:hypothetical protein